MKKLTLLLTLVASMFLVWCGTQKEVVQEPTQEFIKEQLIDEVAEAPIGDEKEFWMNIHKCLMWRGENCDEYLDPTNKDKYADLVQEQCDMMPGMDACDVYFWDKEDHPHDWTEGEDHHDTWHGDLWEKFSWVTFTSEKEQSIDGYDITIKHKDDIHAGEKITWTITVTQWWNKLGGFEKIDGDDWVGLAKHPDGTIDHLHPLAYTDNTLTFSVATEELWNYELLTQFKHDGNVVTVPYQIALTAKADDDHGH